CPYFWPIGDKHILLHFSHSSGAKYLLGDYDKQRDKFVVTHSGAFTFGSVMPAATQAPSATPDGKGGVIAIFNMNEGIPGNGQIMALPRRLTLRPESDLCGKFNPLHIEPAGNIESLRGECTRVGPMKLPANQEVVLETVRGNAMEIVAEIAPQKEQTIELNLLRSPGGEELTRIQCFRDRGIRPYGVPRAGVVSIDTSHSSLGKNAVSRPPESATVELAPDEPLKLRIFIDRSVVEVFVNGRQCLAVRVYPGRADSVGVSLHSRGKDAVLTSLEAFQMKSIYE
ncbi:MAG: glycoside hydrolase family 32 protein, partial [Verrucomicrobiota bacterium]